MAIHLLWDPKFLNYDYIGALWPHYKENQVGNGGFSLRSKKLLESSRKLIEENPDYNLPLIEDDYICREKRLDLEKNSKKIDSITWVADKSKVQLNNNHFLIGRSKKIGNDKIFSLFIEDLKNGSEYEIFRNCTSIDKPNLYFGCGRVPFQIEFIGDIVNDNNPEIILSADKEASALKLVIGFEEGKYQILKWTEFE